MCNVMVIECPTRHHITHREGKTVFYTKQTKAEKNYLDKCKQAMKKIDKQFKGE